MKNSVWNYRRDLSSNCVLQGVDLVLVDLVEDMLLAVAQLLNIETATVRTTGS